MSHPERVREHFDRQAAGYAEASSGRLWSLLRRREETAIMELLSPKPGEAVLDAGCGAGYYTGKLVKARCQVTALDLSGAMLESLKKRLPVETIAGNIERVELPAKFDKILCAGALEFVPDPERALKALAAGLSPAGPRAIVLLMPRRGLAASVYRAFHRWHGFSVHVFDRLTISRLAENAGLVVEEMRAVTFNLACRLVRP